MFIDIRAPAYSPTSSPTARTAGNFTNKFGCRLTVKNGVAVVKNSLRSW